jgi:hypothetical protein
VNLNLLTPSAVSDLNNETYHPPRGFHASLCSSLPKHVVSTSGGYGNVLTRRMGKLDKWALNIVGGVVLPLTMAAEDEEARTGLTTADRSQLHIWSD